MALKVKICGITTLEDARYCAGAGADYLGFIQYPQSPRYIAPADAKDIIAWIYGPEAVGVFVNEEADAINRTAELANFALVQLHGDETPEVCAQIERPVIKAIRVSPEATVQQIKAQMEPYRAHVTSFLLDTHHPTLWGGTGETFNWQNARAIAATYPVLLAGGINAENVEAAVRQVRPLGVDLSSSLEAEPGKKDFDKIAAFFETFDALRGAFETE